MIQVIDEIVNISATNSGSGTIRFESDTRSASVYGTSSQYTSFQVFELVTGRFISEADMDSRRKVVVVTDSFARKYFESTDIIGEQIKLQSYSGDIMNLMIIGVQNTEDDLFASMLDSDEFPVSIYIPLTTFQQFYNQDYLESIDVAVKDSDSVQDVGERIIKLLEFVHGNEDTYLVYSVQDIQQSFSGIINVISAVLLVIAIITLVVGGIGIINILLVSVTERIREIGIRKALGAKKKDIVLQFLMESIMMTGISGLIGILLGIIGGSIISSLINIPPVLDIKTIILAFSGSILLGIMFGVYPAKKAADLDPIESLRYE
jgi:putative ABC transport system permease protein